jgi:hypothetical protein
MSVIPSWNIIRTEPVCRNDCVTRQKIQVRVTDFLQASSVTRTSRPKRVARLKARANSTASASVCANNMNLDALAWKKDEIVYYTVKNRTSQADL